MWNGSPRQEIISRSILRSEMNWLPEMHCFTADFWVSYCSGVIQGKDGWLYYKDSLDDYLGQDLLSDRSLFNIAHMLSMTQQALEERE